MKHHAIYANVSAAEHALVVNRAARAGLSISDYVRRAVNALLLEESEDGPLLAEKRSRDVAA